MRLVTIPTPRLVLLLSLLVSLLLASVSPAHAEGSWSWPLGGGRADAVARPFDPPASRYGAGHRGVDLVGTAGEVVRSVAAGRVVFVGTVAGTPVVTVAHGGEQSTYQPVRATVRRGDAVGRGEAIGRLLARPAHCTRPCLHVGRVRVGRDATGRRTRDYLDPLELLGTSARFRLVDPTGPVPVPPAGALGGSLGSMVRPVAGPVTSAFGMRVHPVTGVRKLHDGTDFGAPCGTPVKAAAAGTVRRVGTVRGYGRWVVLSHGRGLETRYAHLSSQSVRPGQRVGAGQVVGRVGSTGYSTGCHLHLMVVRGGRPVDPMG